ncbi:MAG: FliH/SctL family protein [Sphingomonadaceae bacterium]
MSDTRIAYSALGKRGRFTASPRYSGQPVPQPEPVPVDPATEAYGAGYEDGKLAAQAECEARLNQLQAEREAIELAFARFDADSALLLREGLRIAVHALCEEAVLPLALDHEGLARRIEAAAAMLQRKHDQRVISINPADLELVRGSVSPALELIADTSVARGALRVDTEDGGVEDGPEQWRRALAEAFETCAP